MIINEDATLIAKIIGVITLLTAVVQVIGRKWTAGRDLLRKVLHLLVISLCAFAIHNVGYTVQLQYIFLGFTAILLLVVKMKILNISSGKSYGIALFPLAFALLLMIDGLPKSYIVIAGIILAVADPMAGILGNRYAQSFWTPLDEKKSALGSGTFFIATLILLPICFNQNWPDINLSFGWVAIILVAMLTMLSELFSWRGSDNLSIPIIAGLSLQAVAIHGATNAIYVAIGVTILGFGLVKMRWLNVGGMLAVLFMATWLALMIHPVALLLPVTFLVMGSLLSKLNRGDKSLSKDDSIGRDASQVFANGGMGMIMAIPYLLTHNDHYLFLFALVFGSAMSDTASSEIGRWLKGKTWSLVTLKQVVPGESGGISIAGTFAGFIGALLISLVAYVALELKMSDVLWLTILGFSGMVIDSILGAYVQGKYRVHGILLEEGNKDQLISGYHWVSNSMVNFLSGAIIVWIGYLLF